MKRWLYICMTLGTLLLLAPTARTQAQPAGPSLWPAGAPLDGQETAIAVTQEITGTGELTGSVRIATALANYFDYDVQEILDLHAADLGFGNIAKALFTSLAANISLADVLALRAQDIGWGEIRQSLGLPAGTAHQSLGQVVGRGNAKAPDWVPPGQAKKLAKGQGPKGKP